MGGASLVNIRKYLNIQPDDDNQNFKIFFLENEFIISSLRYTETSQEQGATKCVCIDNPTFPNFRPCSHLNVYTELSMFVE